MRLRYDENGLIPAIVQDARTGQVLTLAYMNAESLALTLAEKRSVFYSRSRRCIWRKGETSGNVQHLLSVTADCDGDALLLKVEKDGPACHTGAESCFHNPVCRADTCAADASGTDGAGAEGSDYVSDANGVRIESGGVSDADGVRVEDSSGGKSGEGDKNGCAASDAPFSTDALYALLKGRKSAPVEGSYTSYLFEKGLEKILKKVGEESTEVIIAGAKRSKEETVYELADLVYHCLVLMAESGIEPDDVRRELAKRRVIDKKQKQETMK